jgi:tripeptidyl-peptidase-1
MEGINGGIGGHVKAAYAQGLNAQFEKLGVLGHSVIIASGDSGVYNRLPLIGDVVFHPSFPAVLPAVTAVGATKLESDGSEDTAVAWSGGGFSPSKYFTRANATWQESAVAAYLKSGVSLPPSWQWDKQGRGIPDVSAVGVDFQVVTNGGTGGVAGTSASTPAVAGMVALLNDARLKAGKSPLGFVNPFFYQNPSAFNDIKKGKNNGGGLKSLLPGFEATTGWDPVTGLGTPHFDKLLQAALSAH